MEIDFTPGRFAVCNDYEGPWTPKILQITKETPQMIVAGRRQKYKSSVLATTADREGAERLVQGIGGVAGEMNRRQQAAAVAANQHLDRLIANAR